MTRDVRARIGVGVDKHVGAGIRYRRSNSCRSSIIVGTGLGERQYQHCSG